MEECYTTYLRWAYLMCLRLTNDNLEIDKISVSYVYIVSNKLFIHFYTEFRISNICCELK